MTQVQSCQILCSVHTSTLSLSKPGSFQASTSALASANLAGLHQLPLTMGLPDTVDCEMVQMTIARIRYSLHACHASASQDS